MSYQIGEVLDRSGRVEGASSPPCIDRQSHERGWFAEIPEDRRRIRARKSPAGGVK